MITPTRDQSFQRWDILPDNLREALCLEANSDFIWKTSTDEHVPENRIHDVSRVAGYVLLGFLHPEDVAQELVDVLKIDSRTAKSIQDSLNNRIFMPLRADIDKVYSPLSKLGTFSATASPKIIQDVNTPVPTPARKAATLSDIGWSKMPSAISPTPTRAEQSSTPTPIPPRSATIPMPTPTPPPAPAEPAPMMLHEDTTFKPAEKNEGFTLPKPSANTEMHIAAGISQAPIRPAVLEFGGAKIPVPKPATPAAAGTYYGGFGLSLSSTPIASIGSRNVSQIMPTVPAPIPKPPAPITTSSTSASSVPIPPQPPKPIVKDFL